MFSQPVATGSFSASCQEESEDKELQSSAGSCILHLGTELCRVLSFSAWLCGRSSSPLLCILNVLGDYFSAFHQTFGGFISLVNVHIEAVPCLVKAMLFLVQSVCPAWSKNHPSVTTDQEVFPGCIGKSSSPHNGLDRLDRIQVERASVPAVQLNHALQVPL